MQLFKEVETMTILNTVTQSLHQAQASVCPKLKLAGQYTNKYASPVAKFAADWTIRLDVALLSLTALMSSYDWSLDGVNTMKKRDVKNIALGATKLGFAATWAGAAAIAVYGALKNSPTEVIGQMATKGWKVLR